MSYSWWTKFPISISTKRTTRKPTVTINLLFILVVSILTLFLTYTSLFDLIVQANFNTKSFDNSIPACKHSIVFSGARQGSTWFLDSIENCTYSNHTESWHRYYSNVFNRTELWKHFGNQMDKYQAINYILTNTSIKIFPSVLQKRQDDVIYLLQHAKNLNIPIMVLRRNVQDAWKSWTIAETSGEWNLPKHKNIKLSNTQQINKIEHMYQYFINSRRRWDERINQLLKETNVVYDLFDFDQVKDKKLILAKQNHCYIRNCNFRQDLVYSKQYIHD